MADLLLVIGSNLPLGTLFFYFLQTTQGATQLRGQPNPEWYPTRRATQPKRRTQPNGQPKQGQPKARATQPKNLEKRVTCIFEMPFLENICSRNGFCPFCVFKNLSKQCFFPEKNMKSKINDKVMLKYLSNAEKIATMFIC